MIVEHKIIELFGKKVFEKAVVTAPFSTPNPLENEACFLFILEGHNHSYSEQDHVLVKQNEGVLMKCGNYMYQGIADDKSGRFGLLAVHFYPEVLKKIYEKELPDFLKKNYRSYSSNMTLIKANQLINKFVDDILFYIDSPELYDEELIILKMKEIIVLLLKTENADKVLDILYNFFSPRLFTLKEIVESHIFTPISISSLAQLCNFSLASFKREFQHVYKDSPANYIKNRRLDKAAELLVVSNETVSSIAYDCQFNSIAHFSSSFKAKYKMTPTDFRMSQNR